MGPTETEKLLEDNGHSYFPSFSLPVCLCKIWSHGVNRPVPTKTKYSEWSIPVFLNLPNAETL